MRTEAFSPWLCTCVLMMARFSEFPRAKQELPRQTTISTAPSSWVIVHLFMFATAPIAIAQQASCSREPLYLLCCPALVPRNGRASESALAGTDCNQRPRGPIRSEEHTSE